MLEVLRSGRLSLGPMGERFERDFADWLGVEDAVAVSSGTAGAAPRRAGARLGPGRRGPDQPLQLRRLRQLPALRGRPAGLLRRRPGDAQPRPGGRRGRRVGERTAGILPVHIFGYPAAMPELEALAAEHGLGILEDACEALGAVDSEGRRVGARGNLATFAFYANKQMTTGEGGMIVPPDAARSPRACAASATRAAPPTWAGSTTAASASTTASPTSPPRSASPRSRSSTRCSSARAAVAALYAERLAGDRGRARRRSPAAARELRSWFVYPVRLAAGRRPRRDDRPPRRARHRHQGLPALHPPLPAPARARLPRGPVPGRRSRLRRARWRCPSSPR